MAETVLADPQADGAGLYPPGPRDDDLAEPDGLDTGDEGFYSPRTLIRGFGVSLVLLAVLVLGFAGYLYGLSGVQEGRSQLILYARFRSELASETGPLGPVTPGSPVAVLDIPSIGVANMIVVEGTTPENLSLGPGHLRDTPLPGQAGVSEIFGRRATFGAPFASLGRLKPGAIIRVVTSQGRAAYRVAVVAGGSQSVVDPAPNRLLLLTASSPAVPAHVIEVDARLITPARADPGVVNVISPAELPLAGDGSALIQAMGWGLLLVLVSAAATIAAARWSPWTSYFGTVPLTLAVLWCLYHSVAALLPNLY